MRLKSKRLKPRRLVVLGFLGVILAGTVLLKLPVSSATGESIPLVDSLFTSTSAVCVTGLATVDPGTGLSVFGQVVLAALIQIGGLGITLIGVIFIIAAGGSLSIGNQRLLKESLNLGSGKGLMSVTKAVAYVTIAFELMGAVFSYITFSEEFAPGKAIGVSVFHSIAAFNNAGFDILGDFKSLTDYHSNTWLCLVTSGLIIFGGLGFFVISELFFGRNPRKWSLQTKVVLLITAILIVGGTVLLKMAEDKDFSWLEAFFHSVSARTAGFASVSIGDMSKAGLLILIVLMFIGASPGSTGGGIKTTTFFVLVRKIQTTFLNGHCTAFRRTISEAAVIKAFMVFSMAISVVLLSTFLICMLEPSCTFEQILFECVSGFSTTGLSTGITPSLCTASKVILCLTMFVGRLGPMTIATIWLSREASEAVYSEEDVTVG